jgi:colicin import membrane protein
MTTTSAPEGAPSATAPADAGSNAPAPAEGVEDLAALRAAAAELAALKAEGAAARKADREARKRAQEEAEKAGELAKALEAAKSRLAELEAVEPMAQRWRAHEEAEVKRLDAEAAALPEAVRALYADARDVDGKAKILAAFRAAGGSTAPAKSVAAAPALGAPPAVTVVDVEAALADPTGKRLAEIKARDPGAVSQFFSSLLGKRAGSNSLGVGRFASARPTKAPNA